MLAAELKKFSDGVRPTFESERDLSLPAHLGLIPHPLVPRRFPFPEPPAFCVPCIAAAEQTFGSDGIEFRGLQRCDGRFAARTGRGRRRRQHMRAIVAQPFPHGDARRAKKAAGSPLAGALVRRRTSDGVAPG